MATKVLLSYVFTKTSNFTLSGTTAPLYPISLRHNLVLSPTYGKTSTVAYPLRVFYVKFCTSNNNHYTYAVSHNELSGAGPQLLRPTCDKRQKLLMEVPICFNSHTVFFIILTFPIQSTLTSTVHRVS